MALDDRPALKASIFFDLLILKFERIVNTELIVSDPCIYITAASIVSLWLTSFAVFSQRPSIFPL